MATTGLLAYAKVFVLPPWVGWVVLAGAVLFVVGLIALLVITAKKSRWPDRAQRPRSDRP